MNVRTTLLTLLLAAPLALSGACAEPAAPVDLQDPGELGAFAARIEREPDRTEEILADAGVSRDELRQAILDVARDPEASVEYRDAFASELGTAGGS